jgi:hypothetical protein
MTPNTVESRLGILEFNDGMPTAETSALVYDNLDFMRGVETFLNGIPAASVEAIRLGNVEMGVTQAHQAIIMDNFMDPNPLFLNGNTGTVYISSFLDLKRDSPNSFNADVCNVSLSRCGCRAPRRTGFRPKCRNVLGAALVNLGSIRAFAVKSTNDRQWRRAQLIVATHSATFESKNEIISLEIALEANRILPIHRAVCGCSRAFASNTPLSGHGLRRKAAPGPPIADAGR